MYSAGTAGRAHLKLYIMHEDIYEYILYASQADMMKHEEDTGHIVTKIIFLWPDGGAMEFIQDCHIHLFRVEDWSHIWILNQIGQCMCKLEQLLHSWRDIELCCTATATPFNKKLRFSLSVIFNVLSTDWTGFEACLLIPLGTGMPDVKHDISCCQ